MVLVSNPRCCACQPANVVLSKLTAPQTLPHSQQSNVDDWVYSVGLLRSAHLDQTCLNLTSRRQIVSCLLRDTSHDTVFARNCTHRVSFLLQTAHGARIVDVLQTILLGRCWCCNHVLSVWYCWHASSFFIRLTRLFLGLFQTTAHSPSSSNPHYPRTYSTTLIFIRLSPPLWATPAYKPSFSPPVLQHDGFRP